ncbi:MAG: carbohydrate binding domain-containing protein [Erysipelotrichaceae bacterium]|nr:carbohydrate binding domain-containing protein [Erysipelotrichaceae bacterium]
MKTTDDGDVDYSIQLVQANLPFEKGATYKVTFDAYASEAREMGVDIKAPDHGYMSYMPHQNAALTTESQTYSYEFKMTAASDPNGRLEYNMGATGSTADIHITNVKV